MHRTPTPRKPHWPGAPLLGALTSLTLAACQPPSAHPAVKSAERAVGALMYQDMDTLWALLDDAGRQELTRRLTPGAGVAEAGVGPLSAPSADLRAAFAVSLSWQQERLAAAPARFLDPAATPPDPEAPAVDLSLMGDRWRVPVVWVVVGEVGRWRVRLFEARRLQPL